MSFDEFPLHQANINTWIWNDFTIFGNEFPENTRFVWSIETTKQQDDKLIESLFGSTVRWIEKCRFQLKDPHGYFLCVLIFSLQQSNGLPYSFSCIFHNRWIVYRICAVWKFQTNCISKRVSTVSTDKRKEKLYVSSLYLVIASLSSCNMSFQLKRRHIRTSAHNQVICWRSWFF